MKRFIIFFIIILSFTEAFSESRTNHFNMGSSAGWNAPYGCGIFLGPVINESYDLNFGAGLNMSGVKLGMGFNYYPYPTWFFEPYLGCNLVYSTLLASDGIVLSYTEDTTDSTTGGRTTKEESAKYKFSDAYLGIPKAGVRFNFAHGCHFFGEFGYSQILNDYQAKYVSGDKTDNIKKLANFVRPGGLMINIGVNCYIDLFIDGLKSN